MVYGLYEHVPISYGVMTLFKANGYYRYDGVSTKIDDNLNDWAWYLGHAQRNVSWWYSLTLLEKCLLMLLLWDCLKILMDSFTIFWLNKYSSLWGTVQWSEIPNELGAATLILLHICSMISFGGFLEECLPCFIC